MRNSSSFFRISGWKGNSLKRLSDLRVEEFYLDHGRILTAPQEGLQKAVEESRAIWEDPKVLFEILDTKASFARLTLVVRKVPKSQKIYPYPF